MIELKPHCEVTHTVPKILIIGKGWVGTQVNKYFSGSILVDENNSAKDFSGEMFDYAFVCVPTPPQLDGSCDVSIVDAVIQEYKDIVRTFIIRSTIPLGYISKKQKEGFRIIFQPEYIGETVDHPYLKHDIDFIIIGGEKEVATEVGDLWAKVTNPSIRIAIVDAQTAELAKLMENSFLACKVTFFNQFFDLAEGADASYYQLRETFLLDKRMGRSHTQVFPDNRGYAGKCLPKDVANAIACGKTLGVDVSFLEAIQAYNQKLRSRKEK